MAYRLKTFRVQFVADPAEFPNRSPCRASDDVDRLAHAIYETLDADKEHFVLLAMNNKHRERLQGHIDRKPYLIASPSPRVWSAALHLCAAAVVFVHNHPSGDPAPSPEDQEITRRLKETGEMLGIRVLDHVVLGRERLYSFSDQGLI
jgi:DNA repair protein RadC